MRLPTHPRSNAFDLQMTAMIDVVFLLLVFFLWTSSFDEPEFDLSSALSLPPVGSGNAVRVILVSMAVLRGLSLS